MCAVTCASQHVDHKPRYPDSRLPVVAVPVWKFAQIGGSDDKLESLRAPVAFWIPPFIEDRLNGIPT